MKLLFWKVVIISDSYAISGFPDQESSFLCVFIDSLLAVLENPSTTLINFFPTAYILGICPDLSTSM